MGRAFLHHKLEVSILRDATLVAVLYRIVGEFPFTYKNIESLLSHWFIISVLSTTFLLPYNIVLSIRFLDIMYNIHFDWMVMLVTMESRIVYVWLKPFIQVQRSVKWNLSEIYLKLGFDLCVMTKSS